MTKSTDEVKAQSKNSGRPALTPDAKNNEMIALATDLALKQLRDGTASSQIISHFLEQGSPTAKAKREKIELENELTKAKIEALKKADNIEKLYKEALDAMKTYGGHDDDEEY